MSSNNPSSSPDRESLYWIPLAAVFPIVGFVTGWLSGASQTPVIAGLLPLIIGLLGALNLGLLQRTFYAKKVAEQFKQLDEDLQSQLDEGLQSRIRNAFEVPMDTSLRLPAFWALAVAAFSIACFIGVFYGVNSRLSAPVRFERGYPTLEELLAQEPRLPAPTTSDAEKKSNSSQHSTTAKPSESKAENDVPQNSDNPDDAQPSNVYRPGT